MEASLTTDVTDEVRLNLASRQRQRFGGRGKHCSLEFSVMPLQKAIKRVQGKPWVSSAHASTVMNQGMGVEVYNYSERAPYKRSFTHTLLPFKRLRQHCDAVHWSYTSHRSLRQDGSRRLNSVPTRR